MNEQKKTAIPKPEPVKSTSSKKGGKGGGGRGKGGDQETREEKGKISEEEGEEESPLEIAVRKVVSYKMTPKQALSEYKLTPKVMCEGSAFTKMVKLWFFTIYVLFRENDPIVISQVLFDHLLGETDSDRLAILDKVRHVWKYFHLRALIETGQVNYCMLVLAHVSLQELIWNPWSEIFHVCACPGELARGAGEGGDLVLPEERTALEL